MSALLPGLANLELQRLSDLTPTALPARAGMSLGAVELPLRIRRVYSPK